MFYLSCMPMGFSRGPDFGGLLVLAGVFGAIGYAIYAYEGPLWQKLLIAPGMLLVLGVGGLIAALLIAGLAWIFFFVMRRRKKARLERLLRLESESDRELAAAQARSVCESFDFMDSDLFKSSPELCMRFAGAARRAGPLQPCYLRALMDNAPWSREVESALFDGREAIAPRDQWRWLYWFRKTLPAEDPAASDRLAAALEHALGQGNDFHRRGSWADCLEQVRDSEAWRRLAQRSREDLVALQAERGEKLGPRQREGLDVLLRVTGTG
jgi:hypothetical protein